MSRMCMWATIVLLIAGAGLGCRGSQSSTSSVSAPAGDSTGDPQDLAAATVVEVNTSVDRTAVWVGDAVVWTVEVICPPTFDVVEEDLAPEKVAVEGLEIVSADTDRVTTDDGRLIHRVRYHMRSFEISSPVLRTQPRAPLKVRYYVRRPGERAEDLTPAGEVLVPGAAIAWRSTLADTMENVAVRPERSPDRLPTILSIARPLGLTLVLLSVAPFVLWVFSRIQHVRLPRQRRPSARATRSETLGVLARLREADTSTPQALQDAYGQLNEALRKHVAATTNLPATALTADEFADRVTMPSGRLSGTALAEVLADCARARYGRPETRPSADQFSASVEAAERLV